MAVIVIVAMVMSVVVMVVPAARAVHVAMMVVAVVVVARGAGMRAAFGRVFRDHRDEAVEPRAQLGEPGALLARALIHVEAAVHLDLRLWRFAAGSEYARTSSTPLYGSFTFTS